MNRSDETLFDPRIADWLEDDPHTAPDQALDVVLAAFPSINQRRAWRVPWRFPEMSSAIQAGRRGGDRGHRGRRRGVPAGAASRQPYRRAHAESDPATHAKPSPAATPVAAERAARHEHLGRVHVRPLRVHAQASVRLGGASTPITTGLWRATRLIGLARARKPSSDRTSGLVAWSVPFETTRRWNRRPKSRPGSRGILRGWAAPPAPTSTDRAVPYVHRSSGLPPRPRSFRSRSDVQAFFTGGDLSGRYGMSSRFGWGDSDPAVAPFGGSDTLLEAFLSTMCVWPEAIEAGALSFARHWAAAQSGNASEPRSAASEAFICVVVRGQPTTRPTAKVEPRGHSDHQRWLKRPLRAPRESRPCGRGWSNGPATATMSPSRNSSTWTATCATRSRIGSFAMSSVPRTRSSRHSSSPGASSRDSAIRNVSRRGSTGSS